MRTYGTLTLQHGERTTWLIDAEPHVVMKLKRVFGRIKADRRGQLEISDSLETAADLEWVLGRYPLDQDEVAARYLAERARAWHAAQEAVEGILTGERQLCFERQPGPLCELRDYELADADIALTTGYLLNANYLGGGKSFSALFMLRHPESLPAVIVCPTHVPEQWLEYLAIAFPDLLGHKVRSMTPYDPAKRRGKYGTGGRTPDVLIVPYSKLAGWANVLAGEVRTAIIDEAQELRHEGSQKYEAAALVMSRAWFCMELTNTPVYNYGGEAFNVIDAMAQGVLGTREEFVTEWGAQRSNGNVFVRKPGALGSHLRDQRILVCRTRKETGRELEHAEPTIITHLVEADEAVLSAESAGAVDLAELIVSGTGTGIERMQAASELDWKMRRATGLAKAPYVAAFVHMLLESEAKVLLLGWHRDVYGLWQAMYERARIPTLMYTGSESPLQKERAKQAFMRDPDESYAADHPFYRVMMMSLRSGSGLDGLQTVCRVAVFGELDWSPGIHKQCLGRLHRDGQADEVLGYFLHTNTGSDPKVMEVLGIKRGQGEPIVNPDVDLFTPVESGDRVRMLAEAVLARRVAGR